MRSEKYSPENILIRNATFDDIHEIRQLVLDHGNTQWHYFPKDALEEHLKKIASGADSAVIASYKNILVGMVSFSIGAYYLEYEPISLKQKPTGYIVFTR